MHAYFRGVHGRPNTGTKPGRTAKEIRDPSTAMERARIARARTSHIPTHLLQRGHQRPSSCLALRRLLLLDFVVHVRGSWFVVRGSPNVCLRTSPNFRDREGSGRRNLRDTGTGEMPREEEQINEDLAAQEKLIQEVNNQPSRGGASLRASFEARPTSILDSAALCRSRTLTCASCAVRKAVRGDPGHR